MRKKKVKKRGWYNLQTTKYFSEWRSFIYLLAASDKRYTTPSEVYDRIPTCLGRTLTLGDDKGKNNAKLDESSKYLESGRIPEITHRVGNTP